MVVHRGTERPDDFPQTDPRPTQTPRKVKTVIIVFFNVTNGVLCLLYEGMVFGNVSG